MVEELDITVHQRSEPGATSPANELLHTLALASIGALALARDEADEALALMRARAEQAQRDSQHLLAELAQRLHPEPPQESVQISLARGLEQLLKRLNLPSKSDIDDLSAKIAQLTMQMEELRRSSGKAAG